MNLLVFEAPFYRFISRIIIAGSINLKVKDDTITMGRENNMTKNSKVYQKPDDETLRSILSAEQYAVTQRNATERPFQNAYWNERHKGIYVDITTGEFFYLNG